MFSKLSVLLVVALAAIGQASHHDHGRFHQRRQLNGTAAADNSTVTSTVYTTQEIRITACAPTVTSCPAAQKTHTIVTVVTVPAYTTICPATMSLSPYSSPAVPVPASLSSLISTAAATAIPGPSSVNAALSVPLGTGSPRQPSITDSAAGNSFSTSTYVKDETVTYTMGSGSSTTVLTTVVHLTSTKTLFSTLYKTSEAVSSNNAAGAASSNNAAGAAMPTTTIFSTSRTTVFVTVQTPAFKNAAVPVTGPAVNAAVPVTSPAVNVAAAQITGGGSCPEPVTITITNDHTVTVTASPPPSLPSTVNADTSQSAAPAYTDAPYGMGNATATGYASTGFVTLPSGSPTGTGSPISGYRRRK